MTTQPVDHSSVMKHGAYYASLPTLNMGFPCLPAGRAKDKTSQKAQADVLIHEDNPGHRYISHVHKHSHVLTCNFDVALLVKSCLCMHAV